ncbi:MAG: hypothetical protein U0414_37730 [Polyangiaceae bacterium]
MAFAERRQGSLRPGDMHMDGIRIGTTSFRIAHKYVGQDPRKTTVEVAIPERVSAEVKGEPLRVALSSVVRADIVVRDVNCVAFELPLVEDPRPIEPILEEVAEILRRFGAERSPYR